MAKEFGVDYGFLCNFSENSAFVEFLSKLTEEEKIRLLEACARRLQATGLASSFPKDYVLAALSENGKPRNINPANQAVKKDVSDDLLEEIFEAEGGINENSTAAKLRDKIFEDALFYNLYVKVEELSDEVYDVLREWVAAFFEKVSDKFVTPDIYVEFTNKYVLGRQE